MIKMTITHVQDLAHLIETGLNENQRTAVLHDRESLLIIAGAGSGKTRVITTRIAHLIANNGVEPSQIVALTFTNKAAGEMKERLVHLLGGVHRLPFIGTFHSYCLQLLKNYPLLTGMPQFSILDADDQQDLIKKIMKQFALAKFITASQIMFSISRYKNQVAAGNVVALETGIIPMFKEIYLQYEAEKSSARCLDFDDLILRVLDGMHKNNAFRLQLQERIRHILVDEYQDTSDVQHQLLLAMATHNKKLAIDSMCAVGDEDQSIYSWRGATVANMLKYQTDFAPVTTVKIEQNYRSVQPILQAANEVITNNTMRNPKELWSTRNASNRILQLECSSGDQEAEAVATMVQVIADKKGSNDIAILYRTHYQSRSIEEALIHKAIPYKMIGGIRFYERKEIKDLLAYLRLVVNPFDKISLLRIINVPARGLGDKFEEELLKVWQAQPFMDFKHILHFMITDANHGQTPTKTKTIQGFLELYRTINANDAPSMILNQIMHHIDYNAYLTAAYELKEAQGKQENVQEFMLAVDIFEQKNGNKTAILESFLHEVSLLQEVGDKDDQTAPVVLMMTLHAAKGLEFDTVIMAGLEEGLLPSQRSLNTNEELEEERRLMYVGMTRAKEHLVLSNAHTRYTFGQLVSQAPSRFLDELPKKLVQILDLEQLPRYQMRSMLEQWISGLPPITMGMPRSSIAPSKSATGSYSSSPYGQKSAPTGPVYQPYKKTAYSPYSSPSSTTADAGPKAKWYKKQTVYHQKFGPGIVTDVEKAPDNDFYITALFKQGQKKILGKFLDTSP
ncbi:ATP-dependent DNA helicase PcrA [Candidatus Dependentiae bacterium]|nr:ATP-dependent DNA helicase PcrA [Candidatus Dependentiae bacterium]